METNLVAHCRVHPACSSLLFCFDCELLACDECRRDCVRNACPSSYRASSVSLRSWPLAPKPRPEWAHARHRVFVVRPEDQQVLFEAQDVAGCLEALRFELNDRVAAGDVSAARLKDSASACLSDYMQVRTFVQFAGFYGNRS